MVVVEQCLSCGEPITQPPTGRPRLWCSATCRQRGSRAAQAHEAIIIGAMRGDADQHARLRALLGRLSDEELGMAEDRDQAMREAIAEVLVAVEKMNRLAAQPDAAWRRLVLGEALAAACAGFVTA